MNNRKGLIHYWPLDETTGSTAADLINGQQAEVTFDTAGDTIADGWIGKGRNLAIPYETYSYISLYNNTPNTTYSLDRWSIGLAFRHTDEVFSWLPELLRIGWEETTDATIVQLYLSSGSGGDTLHLEIYSSDFPAVESTSVVINYNTTSGALVAGQHYAFVSCNGLRTDLILDGVLVGSVAKAIPLQPRVADCNIGGGGDWGLFGGVVDEITIWDRYVSATEAAAMWAAGVGVTALAYVESLEAAEAWAANVNPLTSQVYYACEITDGVLAAVRIPISSWQATIQADRSSYTQAVVPNIEPWLDAIAARPGAEFIIYRGVRFLDGSTEETELARAPLTLRYDIGQVNATGTLTGYAQFDESSEQVTRDLQGVRLISVTDTNARARAEIDFFLRPGQIARHARGEFRVAWINYYVNANQEYMDVGSRPL